MSTSRPHPALLDQPLPARVRLAAAWTSFMFLYLYVDYLHFYKPGSLEEVLGGRVHEFDTGPTFVALAVSGEQTWDYAYFYGYSIGLELLILAFVLRTAWTWPRGAASSATSAADRP